MNIENKKNLQKTEPQNTLFQGRLHAIIFAIPIILMLLGCFLAWDFGAAIGMPIFIIGAIWGIYAALDYLSSSIIITNHVITVKTGIFVQQTRTVSMSQMESVDVTQSLVGSFLNYGSLLVRGTGGTTAAFNPLSNPLTCRRILETL